MQTCHFSSEWCECVCDRVNFGLLVGLKASLGLWLIVTTFLTVFRVLTKQTIDGLMKKSEYFLLCCRSFPAGGALTEAAALSSQSHNYDDDGVLLVFSCLQFPSVRSCLKSMAERLTRRSSSYRTAAEFLSDIRRLFRNASQVQTAAGLPPVHHHCHWRGGSGWRVQIFCLFTARMSVMLS